MGGTIGAREFHERDGVEDWRVLAVGACAHFRTGSFATGVTLVETIGRLADEANHHPDVDLRYASVTVRLVSHDVDGLSERDVKLARAISVAAHSLEVSSDPSALQDVGLTLDALVTEHVRPFWRAILGYRDRGDDDVIDPHGRWPFVWFQPMDPARSERSRLHVDVFVPHDVAEARVAAALAAGGHLVSAAHAPAWWTLADAEGNEVDVATWMGRD